MGMPDAFGTADFSGMIARGGIWIQVVRHKTALEVNETGSIAAGATQVSIGRGGPPPIPFTMTVDHPFLIAIEDKDGTLLFLGSIVKPDAGE